MQAPRKWKNICNIKDGELGRYKYHHIVVMDLSLHCKRGGRGERVIGKERVIIFLLFRRYDNEAHK